MTTDIARRFGRCLALNLTVVIAAVAGYIALMANTPTVWHHAS